MIRVERAGWTVLEAVWLPAARRDFTPPLFFFILSQNPVRRTHNRWRKRVSEQVLYICIPKSTSLRFRSRSFMNTLPSQVCSRCPMASIFEQRSCSKLDKTVLCIAETMPKPLRCIKSMSTSQGAGDCSFDPYLHAFAPAYQLHVQNIA